MKLLPYLSSENNALLAWRPDETKAFFNYNNTFLV